MCNCFKIVRPGYTTNKIKQNNTSTPKVSVRPVRPVKRRG